jgi:transcriptional regulator with XRE-family HTH domain
MPRRRSLDEQPSDPRLPDWWAADPEVADPPSLGFTPEFAEAFGRTIKVIRTDLDISRRELADRAGISYSYLTEIENGNKPPSSSVIRQLAHALGLRMSQLTHAAELRLDAGSEDSAWAAPEAGPAQALGQAYEARSQPRARAPVSAASAAPIPAGPAPRAATSGGGGLARDWALQPSLRGPNRTLRPVLLELERLLPHMAPDDIERLLDYARRLAR